MAAPTFIAKSTAQASSAASWDIAYMGGIVEGDVLIVFGINNSLNAMTAVTSGWILASSTFFSDDSPGPDYWSGMWYKIADGTESGSVTISRGGTTGGLEYGMAQMYQFRGTTRTIVGTISPKSDGDGAATIVWNNITISIPEATALAWVAQMTSSEVAGTPSGYTEVAVDSINTGPVSASFHLKVKENATSGGATANGGDSHGWVTFHTFLFDTKGRSFVVIYD